ASPGHYSPVFSPNTKPNPYIQQQQGIHKFEELILQGKQVLQHQLRVNPMNINMLNNLQESPYKPGIPNGNSRQVNLTNFVSQTTMGNPQNMPTNVFSGGGSGGFM